ncbi:phage tail protein [Ancylobacter sp. FA202]|uniref:phage tail protein n=1 Tax=Ancylobacter sp. FA202 TaxID=1111106 RepID=UPI00035C874A|nr:tail fiber protein [Ancylobacter sp. FA202]
MEYYVGEIRLFAGTYAPQGWAVCEGQTLAINEYEVLYALVGTTWGGDGVSNFNLPDLRGRVVIGRGQGPGLISRSLGETGGSETVSLVTGQIAHNHQLNASKQPANSITPAQTHIFAAAASTTAPTGFDGLPYVKSTAGLDPRILQVDTLTVSGSGEPHVNVMPSLAINYIIALAGIFPSD